MAPSVEKLAQTGVFFTVTSLPTVMNVHTALRPKLQDAAQGQQKQGPARRLLQEDHPRDARAREQGNSFQNGVGRVETKGMLKGGGVRFKRAFLYHERQGSSVRRRIVR